MIYAANRVAMYDGLFVSDAVIAKHFCAGKMLKKNSKNCLKS